MVKKGGKKNKKNKIKKQKKKNDSKKNDDSTDEEDFGDLKICKHLECCDVQKFTVKPEYCPFCKSNEETIEKELWICLTCGYISCQEHAKLHSLKSSIAKKKHTRLQDPIFANLKTFETICFACELDIDSVENLSSLDILEYENKLKIIISKLKKPPKPEIEEESSQYHQNQYEYITVSKKNKKKKNKKPSIYELLSLNELKPQFEQNQLKSLKGLTNLGNTCFFNSVLQSITQTKEFSSFFLDVDNLRKDVEIIQTNLYAGDLSASLWLYFVNYFASDLKTINPGFLFDQICKKNDQFSSYQQQDAQELLRTLEDFLRMEFEDRLKYKIIEENKIENTEQSEEEIVSEKKKEKIDAEIDISKEDNVEEKKSTPLNNRKYTNIVDEAFKTVMKSTIICHHCKNISTKFEDYLDISLPIPHSKKKDKKNESDILMKAFENLLIQEEKIYQIQPDVLLNPEIIQNYRLEAKEWSNKETTIFDCLWLFTKNEILQGENGYLCENCSHLFDDLEIIEEVEKVNNDFEDEKEEGFPVNNEEEKQETIEDKKDDIEELDICTTSKKLKETVEPISSKNSKQNDEISKEHIINDDKKSNNQIIKIPRKASKQFSFFESPNVLTLHLKRFFREDERRSFRKDDSNVKFPLNLNLNCFMNPSSLEEKNEQNYKLYAVVEHSGGIGGGHYICYVKRIVFKIDGTFERDQWFRISDSNTRESSEKEVLKAEAYILFYEK